MATACLIAMGAFTAAMFVAPIDRVEALPIYPIFLYYRWCRGYLYGASAYMNRNEVNNGFSIIRKSLSRLEGVQEPLVQVVASNNNYEGRLWGHLWNENRSRAKGFV